MPFQPNYQTLIGTYAIGASVTVSDGDPIALNSANQLIQPSTTAKLPAIGFAATLGQDSTMGANTSLVGAAGAYKIPVYSQGYQTGFASLCPGVRMWLGATALSGGDRLTANTTGAVVPIGGTRLAQSVPPTSAFFGVQQIGQVDSVSSFICMVTPMIYSANPIVGTSVSTALALLF